MAHPKVHPDHPTEILSVRLSKPDYQRLKDVARAEDRPLTTQARKFIREALTLSAPQATREGAR